MNKDVVLMIADRRSVSIGMLIEAIENQGVICRKEFYDITAEEVKKINPKGIVLSGSPDHIYLEGSIRPDEGLFDLGIPVLGICYGFQSIVQIFGGEVQLGENPEDGAYKVDLFKSRLFEGMPTSDTVKMARYDRAYKMPDGYRLTASTPTCPICAVGNEEKHIYGVQFHPEHPDSAHGDILFENFIRKICGAGEKL